MLPVELNCGSAGLWPGLGPCLQSSALGEAERRGFGEGEEERGGDLSTGGRGEGAARGGDGGLAEKCLMWEVSPLARCAAP